MKGASSRIWRASTRAVLVGLILQSLITGCGGRDAPVPANPSRPSAGSVEPETGKGAAYDEAMRIWSDEITATQIALADCPKAANSLTDSELREKARAECRKQFAERAARNDEKFRKFKETTK